MLNFCDFIQVYVFSTNHHLKIIRRPCLKVTCQFSVNISNILSFKTTRPASIKFYMLPSGKWGKKIYTFGLCYMTKMALHAHIWETPLKLFFSRTTRLIGM